MANIYLINQKKILQATKVKDNFADQTFRYPVMLLGKNKDLTIAATGNSRKRFSKYDKVNILFIKAKNKY